MIDAASYEDVTNDFIKYHTKVLVDNYTSFLTWKKYEEILDVGCGEGSTTVDILGEMLSKNVLKYNIFATDLLEPMINLAKDKYSNESNVKFEQMDILDQKAWIPFKEKFHKVFSILCLMIVPNPEIWVKNIYDILKPGGQIFFMLVLTNPMLKQHKHLRKQTNWSQYQENSKINFDFHLRDNPMVEFVQNLKYGRFKNIKEFKVDFDTPLKDATAAYRFIKPFKALYDCVPLELQEGYLREMCINIEANFKADKEYSKATYVIVVADK